MSSWLVFGTGLVYLSVSIDQFFKGEGAMSLVFFAYALSNVGFWMGLK